MSVPQTSQSRAFAVFEAATVGLPFCVFKVIFGWFLVDAGPAPLGWALIGLGAIDAVLNLVNLAGLLVGRGRPLPICLSTWLLGRTMLAPRAESIGTAIDMLLAFCLVAVALGGGLLPRFVEGTLPVWNAAVVVNVLGAGLLRLASALRDE